MTTDLIPTIPERVADLARTTRWIEYIALHVETTFRLDDVWFRAYTPNGMFAGEWAFGDLTKAVKSAVASAGRNWTEYDEHLFRP